ncbi:MAG: GNAT family N-acetyltransferase [Gammaproteobacteria bacterium]|jgi:GNAT superfamily N-acetyltransferase
MEISYLADHPEFIEVLAPWICKHWQPVVTDETLESRVAKLQGHMNRESLPIAWVAHSGGEVFGTAALRVHDLPGREDLTPWLGGVFVGPNFRHRGIGACLCGAVEENAKSLFGNDPLYLFTLDKQKWYETMGWTIVEPCTWCGHNGHIMVKTLP